MSYQCTKCKENFGSIEECSRWDTEQLPITEQNRDDYEYDFMCHPCAQEHFDLEKGVYWYREGNSKYAGYEGMKDVTSESSNPIFGLKNILLFKPNALQEQHGVVANIHLEFNYAKIRCTALKSKVSNGLYLIPPQSKEVVGEDEIIYHDDVIFESPVIAQVLRYVESQCKNA